MGQNFKQKIFFSSRNSFSGSLQVQNDIIIGIPSYYRTGTFRNRANFKLAVFEGFTPFWVWRIQKSKNQTEVCLYNSLFISLLACVDGISRTDKPKETGLFLNY